MTARIENSPVRTAGRLASRALAAIDAQRSVTYIPGSGAHQFACAPCPNRDQRLAFLVVDDRRASSRPGEAHKMRRRPAVAT